MKEQKEGFSVRGVLKVNVYKAGVLIDSWEDHNLIVNGAKIAAAHFFGGDGTDKEIAEIGFGTSGTAAAVTDTALTNPFTKDIDSIAYPADGQVKALWTLAESEDNGVAIMEFGLFAEDGTLLARKVRTTAINKESDISLDGSWTFVF